MTPDQQRQLDDVWSTLPAMECRGQCWDSCGSIGMTRPEQERIQARHGIQLPLAIRFQGRCPALTMLGRCAIYADRPTICRLWGLVPSMSCDAGCRPEGGYLTERQGYFILARVAEIAGDQVTADAIRLGWSTPERAAHTEAMLRDRDRASAEDWVLRTRRLAARGPVRYMTAGGRIVDNPTRQGRSALF